MTFVAVGPVGAVLDDVQPKTEGKNFALGNTCLGADGNKRVLVEASATIAAATPGTEVAITEPAFTAAAGSGGFRAPDGIALVSGDQFWAREDVLGNG